MKNCKNLFRGGKKSILHFTGTRLRAKSNCVMTFLEAPNIYLEDTTDRIKLTLRNNYIMYTEEERGILFISFLFF